MGLEYFFNKSLTIKRRKYIDINRSVFSATGTACSACIQEPSPEKIALYGGEIGKLFQCFVDISCLAQAGDKIISNGIRYSVRDHKTMDFGSTQYKNLMLVKDDQ